MNVGDTVTVRTIDGRDHTAEVVAVHENDVLDLDLVDHEVKVLTRIARAADAENPTPFTWRPA